MQRVVLRLGDMNACVGVNRIPHMGTVLPACVHHGFPHISGNAPPLCVGRVFSVLWACCCT